MIYGALTRRRVSSADGGFRGHREADRSVFRRNQQPDGETPTRSSTAGPLLLAAASRSPLPCVFQSMLKEDDLFQEISVHPPQVDAAETDHSGV